VQQLSASSVLFGGPNWNGDGFQMVGSGTLVANSMVLCSAHSLQTWSDSDIAKVKIFMFYECDQATALAGNRNQYRSEPDFLKCNPIRPTTNPIAAGVKVVERGGPDLDYALMAITWTDFTLESTTGTKIVQIPRYPVASQVSSSFSKEVILVSHPSEEVTQVSAGTLLQQFGPDPMSSPPSGLNYGYATFVGEFGSSGGGVFNQSGQLIGVLKGVSATDQGRAFLNLGQVVNALPASRIAGWMNQGLPPVKASDPVEQVSFRIVP
jgi:hypothetical protein